MTEVDSTKNEKAEEKPPFAGTSEDPSVSSRRRLSWSRAGLMGGLALGYLYFTGYSPVGVILLCVGTLLAAFSGRTPFKWRRASLIGGLGLGFLFFFPIHRNASVVGLVLLVAIAVMLAGTFEE